MNHQTPPRPPAIIAGGTERAGIPLLDFLRRHHHWTLPPLLVLPLALAGFALAAFREHTGTVVASVVIAVCVWWFAPHRWQDKNGKPRSGVVWFARLSVAGAGGWLSVTSFTGLTWIMFFIACGLLLAWGVPWFIHRRPRSSRADQAVIAEWGAWWLHHARQWSLHGSGVADVTSKGTMETLVIQLWKGHQTVRNVADAAPLIESALAGYVRPGMTRVDRHPGDPSKALVRLKRDDPLGVASAWHAGMAISSVLQPAPFGFSESGEQITVSLLSNWFILGKTRGGKSNQLSLMLTAVTGSDDARAWLIDMKGGRAARPWMPALDWVATSTDEAGKMIAVLKDEIKARAMHADDSHEQLRPTREVPALFLFIDETYEVTSVPAGNSKLAADLAVIASQGMGVAIHVVVVTQYGALDESVRTEQTRSNLLNRVCFAVSRADHGQFALSDWQKIDASKLREKGSFYMQLGPEASSAPGRGYHMPHELVRQIAARHGAMPRLPLVLYASQHQGTYDQRWARLPQPFWRSAPQTDDLAPTAAPSPAPSPPPEGGTPAADGAFEATAQAMSARIEEEIRATPDVTPLRMPSDAALKSAVSASKHRFARALTEAPPEGVTPKQLGAASGMSRSWIMVQLRALTTAGVVVKPDPDGSQYRAAEGADVMAALDEIRRTDDALLTV